MVSMKKDLLYQLSICDVPHIGPVHTKILCEVFGSALEIFRASTAQLETVEGIGSIRARSIKQFRNFNKAEKEMVFIEKYGIQPLFLTDDAYPKRLLNCYDPPPLLFYKGTANLNTSRIVSVVGTRNNSEYGRMVTEKLMKELAALNVLIVSGLAYGIDSIAHKNALLYGAATVGVLGHGLDSIYPSENTQLAKEMVKNGGLLTEFRSKTSPDKHNFPSRNRIVAGISDATIIIESGIKGGSMITADIAGGYNREVFAYPGRTIDSRSAGCNYLIRSNKAVLTTDPVHLTEAMGWENPKQVASAPRQLFLLDLGEHEKKIIELLRMKESLAIGELTLSLGISGNLLASALLNLEMQKVTKSLPGKRYRLLDSNV